MEICVKGLIRFCHFQEKTNFLKFILQFTEGMWHKLKMSFVVEDFFTYSLFTLVINPIIVILSFLQSDKII